MTLQKTKNTITLVANGTNKTFTFDFRIDDSNHVNIYYDGVLQDPAPGFTIVKQDLGVEAGGDIVFDSAPPAGDLTIERSVPYDQKTDYTAYDPFSAETHERALDKLTMLAQQLAEQTGRQVIIAINQSGFDTEIAPISADKFLKINSGADGFSLVTGDPGTDEEAIHDNEAGEINSITEKTDPVDNDIIIIEDSENSYVKKKSSILKLPVLHQSENEFSSFTEKTELHQDDLVLIENSEASYQKRKAKVQNIRFPIVTLDSFSDASKQWHQLDYTFDHNHIYVIKFILEINEEGYKNLYQIKINDTAYDGASWYKYTANQNGTPAEGYGLDSNTYIKFANGDYGWAIAGNIKFYPIKMPWEATVDRALYHTWEAVLHSNETVWYAYINGGGHMKMSSDLSRIDFGVETTFPSGYLMKNGRFQIEQHMKLDLSDTW